jgi:hypothetical protein
MHRVTEERTHRECEWKHGEGHGAKALDRKEPPRRLDKQCLLMEVRLPYHAPQNSKAHSFELVKKGPFE